jgi:solute carrier family 25 folate transporter 32
VINFWSSIIAGASSTIVTNPIWVIKTRLMSQSGHHSRHKFSSFPKGANTPTSRPTLHSSWHYRSTLDAARKMYTTEGVLSFYSGLTPALLGLTHVAVQFPAYEYLKTRFTGQGMGGATTSPQDGQGQWFGVLSASILSKILASSATYPHEVIRTRLQTQRRPVPGQEYLEGVGGAASTNGKALPPDGVPQQSQQPRYKGVVMTVRTILREEGWRAFYAGMGTNMMRAVPAATVTMLTYEYVMRRLQQKRFDGRAALEGRPRPEREP